MITTIEQQTITAAATLIDKTPFVVGDVHFLSDKMFFFQK